VNATTIKLPLRVSVGFMGGRAKIAICAVVASLTGGAVVAAPGQLDATFGNAGQVAPVPLINANALNGSAVIVGGGSIVLVHICSGATVPTSICALRMTPAGAVDPTFGLAGVADVVFPSGSPGAPFAQPVTKVSVVVQPDGKLILSAPCVTVFAVAACIARLMSDGALDTSFNSAGTNPGALVLPVALISGVTTNAVTVSTALQSNGKIVVSATCNSDMCVTRLTSSGALDVTFASAGSGSARVLSFGPNSRSTAGAMLVDGADRIVMVGTCRNTFLATSHRCVARLAPNGSTDITFANPQGLGSWFTLPPQGDSDNANDLLIQPDGRIVILGDCGASAASSTCLTRLMADGTTDSGFSSASSTLPGTVKISLPDGFRASRSMALQMDGKIVFAGECSAIFSLFCVGRINANGTLDSTFDESPGNGNGIVQLVVGSGAGSASSTKIDGAGRILVYGSCPNASGRYPACVARLVGGNADLLACAINVDGNQSVAATTDATLITRYLLGFRGDALTTDALGASPTRTGQALETHLASLNLDADGDGQALAMTDGLLMLRAMLGLTGDALTAGATNAAHPNVRNAQQILTWIEQTHGVACLP
jgi:uncharacterized delta-60 repeat protein